MRQIYLDFIKAIDDIVDDPCGWGIIDAGTIRL